jgi:hypothetical protein
MKPGDIVMFRDDRFGRHRFWQIRSCCHGALGQEGLIELQNLLEEPGEDTEDRKHVTTWVPEPMLRRLEIFTPARRD